MISRFASSRVIARHLLAFVSVGVLSLILFCIVPYLFLTIEHGPNPGPLADMSGIAIMIGIAICAPSYFISLALIGLMSEFGRQFLRPRMSLLTSALLMAVASFIVAFAVAFIILSFILRFETPRGLALLAGVALTPLGTVYWMVLDLSRHFIDGKP